MELAEDKHKWGSQMAIPVWHLHGNQLHKAHSDPQLYCACNPAQTNAMYVSLSHSYSRMQYYNIIVITSHHFSLFVLWSSSWLPFQSVCEIPWWQFEVLSIGWWPNRGRPLTDGCFCQYCLQLWCISYYGFRSGVSVCSVKAGWVL
jgi:hypothetical protein